MDQKQRFVVLADSGEYTITELCEKFGVSRDTGHRWLKRWRASGMGGLEERSRARKTQAGKTSQEIERLIVRERRHRPTWGPKKIHWALVHRHGVEDPPAISTIGAVLKRHGLVTRRRRRPGVFKVERGRLTEPERCNEVFAVDFKGWFCTGDGERFDPLTVTDLHSHYLLAARGLPQATTGWTKRAFTGLFKHYGLPEIIRVDNGAPFASMGPGGLSRLSVWWIQQGIEVQFTRPGHPEDNGSHERMHRTLKQECCRPASVSWDAQQQRLQRWRQHYNRDRPHESLGQKPPGEVYQPSARRFNGKDKVRLYEEGVRTWPVNQSGHISLDGHSCYVGESFAGTEVALEEQGSGLYAVRFANVRLGQLSPSPSARLRPTPSAGRAKRLEP